MCVCASIHKYINKLSESIFVVCMYVGFRTDNFALDNPFGDLALGEANFSSLSLLAAFNSSSMGVILREYPFHMSMSIVLSLLWSYVGSHFKERQFLSRLPNPLAPIPSYSLFCHVL